MPTKTNGAELKAFYLDDAYWRKSSEKSTDDVWHEDLVLLVNGAEQPDDFSITTDLRDEDEVTITSGWVMSNVPTFKERSFEAFFKAWRKAQDTAFLSVSVPKDKLEAVKAAIRAAGGSVK